MKIFTLTLLLLIANIINAQNAVVTYQGQLKANGVPVNASAYFEVTYYNSSQGGPGALLGSEEYNSVSVIDGLFTLPLGSSITMTMPMPLDIIFSAFPDVWIELRVNGVIQTPLQKINLAPYAVDAISLDGRQASEYALSTQLTTLINRINDLEQQVADLENKTQFIEVVGTNMKITGANLNILSGSGTTDGAINGLGNLIVGYNENQIGYERTGSHNIIVGDEHTYSSYAGFVAGFRNVISKGYASVTAGEDNTASGFASSVSGGRKNTAKNPYASVTGGYSNIASGSHSVVVGGGNGTTIDGNKAFADYSVVVGGYRNTTGDGIDANIGIHSVIVAGHKNDTKSDAAVVVGGLQNHADGSRAIVSGGRDNHANNSYSSISGGRDNIANGDSSSVSGGSARTATGVNDWVAGTLLEDF